MFETNYGTFSVNNMDALKESTFKMSNALSQLSSNTNRVRDLLEAVKESWVSTGEDAKSYSSTLNATLNKLDYRVIKILKEYVLTMGLLVDYTEKLEKQNMN